MSVARLTVRKMHVTSMEYLIKALDSYGKLIMSLKAVYALVAFLSLGIDVVLKKYPERRGLILAHGFIGQFILCVFRLADTI